MNELQLLNRQRWQIILRMYRSSGLSGLDFCAVYGLSHPTFSLWKSRLSRRRRIVFAEVIDTPGREVEFIVAGRRVS
jgi:hypothetical protein